MSSLNQIFLLNDRRSIEFVSGGTDVPYFTDATINRIEIDYEMCRFPTVKIAFNIASGSAVGLYTMKNYSLSACFYDVDDVDIKAIKFDNVTVTNVDHSENEVIVSGVVTKRTQNITTPQYRYLGTSLDEVLKKIFPSLELSKPPKLDGRYYQLGLNDVEQYCLLVKGAFYDHVPVISESGVTFLSRKEMMIQPEDVVQYKILKVIGQKTPLDKQFTQSDAINKFNSKNPLDFRTFRYGTKTLISRYNLDYANNLLYNSRFYHDNGVSYVLEYEKIIKERLGDVIKFEVGDVFAVGPIVSIKHTITTDKETTLMKVLNMSSI